MRLSPTVVTAAAAAVAALAFTSAPPTALLTDPAGDGNAINGQGLADEDVGTADTGPATIGHADLTSLDAATLYDVTTDADGVEVATVTGLRFRLGTAAQPSAEGVPTITRIMADIDGCSAWIQFYAGSNGSQDSGAANVRVLDGCGIVFDDPTTTSQTFTTDAITATWDDEAGVTDIDIDFAGLPAELAGRVPRRRLHLRRRGRLAGQHRRRDRSRRRLDEEHRLHRVHRRRGRPRTSWDAPARGARHPSGGRSSPALLPRTSTRRRGREPTGPRPSRPPRSRGR